MSNKEYVLNTRNSSERNKNIGNKITLKIPNNTVNFFILYVKPNLITPNFLKLTLTDTNQKNPSEHFVPMVTMLLLFSGFILALKSAKDNRSLSDLFLSLIWISFFIVININSQFLYFNHFNMEILYPILWLITSQSLMIGFIVIKESRHELPIGFLSGNGTGNAGSDAGSGGRLKE